MTPLENLIEKATKVADRDWTFMGADERKAMNDLREAIAAIVGISECA